MSANMIGVRFRDASKIYHFAPPADPVQEGEYVVVRTARGLEMARVVTLPPDDAGPVPRDARPIVRLADADDRERAERMRARSEEILARARALIAARDLPMYAATMQLNLAGEEATCHFQSDRHVDFTSVVHEVEDEFDIRLHMQQSGPRDRAKLVDGHDICGLRLCCSSWMTDFPKVGIRMAKEQSLALNPDKLSGVCGRLLCCLTFEYPVYREMRGTLPKLGKRVSTPAGMGKVVQANVLKQTITLELDDHAGRVEVSAAEVGMAVRIEDEPNAALEETLSDVLGRPATTQPADEPAAGPAAAPAAAPADGPADGPASRGVRRGGRPPKGGPRAGTPEDGGGAAPADPSAAGEDRPGRRRRRRSRRRGRATTADAAAPGGSPPAAGATDGRASATPASPPDATASPGTPPENAAAGVEGQDASRRRRRRRRRRRGGGGGSDSGSQGGSTA